MVKAYSKKSQGTKKLSANFSVSEFACKDGSDEVLIDDNLVAYLQKIRDWAKVPVVITSSYRNKKYNAKIGGATNSYHTKGQAADIVVKGKKPIEVAQFAEGLGIKGIGCYNDDLFVHIDTRTSKSFWYNQTCTVTSTFFDSKYKIGTYIVKGDVLNVRSGAGTNYAKKKFSEFSKDAQSQILSKAKKKVDGFVKSMTCYISEVKGDFGKTPSGWICLKYCTKV